MTASLDTSRRVSSLVTCSLNIAGVATAPCNCMQERPKPYCDTMGLHSEASSYSISVICIVQAHELHNGDAS